MLTRDAPNHETKPLLSRVQTKKQKKTRKKKQATLRQRHAIITAPFSFGSPDTTQRHRRIQKQTEVPLTNPAQSHSSISSSSHRLKLVSHACPRRLSHISCLWKTPDGRGDALSPPTPRQWVQEICPNVRDPPSSTTAPWLPRKPSVYLINTRKAFLSLSLPVSLSLFLFLSVCATVGRSSLQLH